MYCFQSIPKFCVEISKSSFIISPILSLLQEAKVKEINEMREKEKITAQLRAANHQQLLELQSNKKEKLDNLQTKVNVLYDNGCNKYNGIS